MRWPNSGDKMKSFTHPCKGTCSGYNQDCADEIKELEEKLRDAKKDLKEITDKYKSYDDDVRENKDMIEALNE